MKPFATTIFLGLGMMIISQTHGNLVKKVIGKPHEKLQTYAPVDAVDLENLDLDNPWKLEQSQKKLKNSSYDDLQNSYGLLYPSNSASSYNTSPQKAGGHNKNSDLSDMLGSYHGGAKDIYSSTTGTLGHPSSSYIDDNPAQQVLDKEYSTNNLVYKLPNGQRLTCIVS